jgi:hypothetical protein
MSAHHLLPMVFVFKESCSAWFIIGGSTGPSLRRDRHGIGDGAVVLFRVEGLGCSGGSIGTGKAHLAG